VPDALAGCAPGEARSFVVVGPLQSPRVEDDRGRVLPAWAPGIGTAWAFLVDSRVLPPWLAAAVSVAYLGLLVLPFGYWASASLATLAGAAALLASLIAAPGIWGTPGIDWLQAAGVLAGVLLGIVTTRSARARS
jgi:hypothetical protein